MSKTCSANNCTNQKYSTDYCKTHYQRINKVIINYSIDDPMREELIKEILLNKPKKCSFEGCSEPHRRNGYCANHSQKFLRGTLGIEKKEKSCSKEGCNVKHYSKGYCLRHYRQLQRQELSVKVGLRSTELEKGNTRFEYTSIEAWSRAVKRFFGNNCMICNWNNAPCDAHHIIEKSKDGPNTLQNAVVLCPNHHAEAHSSLLTKEQLQEYNTKAIQTLTEVEPPKEIECQFGLQNH